MAPIDPPPERSAALERLHDVVESAMAATVVGGMLAPHYRAAVSAAFEAALLDWYRQLVHAIERAEQRIGHVELEARLARMDTAAALNALTQSAGRTSDPDKRQLLAGAVEGLLLEAEPEAELRDLFLGFVDAHSTSQVRLLRVLQSPTAIEMPRAAHGGYNTILEAVGFTLPHLRVDPAQQSFDDSLVNVLGQALDRDGLCVWGLSRGNVAQHDKLTTNLGDRYLRFLADVPMPTGLQPRPPKPYDGEAEARAGVH